MASKRRNMFHKNKTQETTEKGGPTRYHSVGVRISDVEDMRGLALSILALVSMAPVSESIISFRWSFKRSADVSEDAHLSTSLKAEEGVQAPKHVLPEEAGDSGNRYVQFPTLL
ncbi:hypothetical protein AAG570_006587 [Ranatra chinensis]|uniref:Uncharacterized protein n=1 Tax=Ranatra chinensis TaxID=642074 RepID=A0ABD0YUF6_9HEMI